MEEKTGQPGGTSNSQKRNQWKQTLLTSSEGRVLLIGVALAFAYTAWLAVKLLVSPEESQVLIGVTATGITFGRAAGMAFGYSLGMGHSTVISICIIIETVQVLVFYPLFVFSWRHLLILKWLKRIMERTHQAAERHKEKIQKYGVIGLFAFVWFPFWMTGPVVGSVIGFLLGLLPSPVAPAGGLVQPLCGHDPDGPAGRHYHRRPPPAQPPPPKQIPPTSAGPGRYLTPPVIPIAHFAQPRVKNTPP